MDLTKKLNFKILIFYSLLYLVICNMDVQELKSFAYPTGLNRGDMVYIHGDAREITAYLEQTKSQNNRNLHITVKASVHIHMDINRIDNLSELHELWIVKDNKDPFERMSFKYRNDSHPSLPIAKFHLDILYDYE